MSCNKANYGDWNTKKKGLPMHSCRPASVFLGLLAPTCARSRHRMVKGKQSLDKADPDTDIDTNVVTQANSVFRGLHSHSSTHHCWFVCFVAPFQNAAMAF